MKRKYTSDKQEVEDRLKLLEKQKEYLENCRKMMNPEVPADPPGTVNINITIHNN